MRPTRTNEPALVTAAQVGDPGALDARALPGYFLHQRGNELWVD
jgi:hypothetical protein